MASCSAAEVVLDVASMFESPNKDTLTATIICLVFLLIMFLGYPWGGKSKKVDIRRGVQGGYKTV